MSGLHVNQHRRLTETLPNASFIDASRLIYEVRKTKSAAEIEYMREAGRLTVLGIEAAMAEIAPGKTDNDLSAACHEAMIRAGSEYFTKWQNIMTGHRTGFHHSFHARFPIAPGDLVYMELGASYKRYDALMMRSASLGPPDDLTLRMTDAMLRTFDVLTSNIRPGRTCHDVAMEAKKAVGSVAEEAFFIENFGYSVGIGVPSIWGEDLIFIAEGVDEPPLAGYDLPHSAHHPRAGEAGCRLQRNRPGHRDRVGVTDCPRKGLCGWFPSDVSAIQKGEDVARPAPQAPVRHCHSRGRGSRPCHRLLPRAAGYHKRRRPGQRVSWGWCQCSIHRHYQGLTT